MTGTRLSPCPSCGRYSGLCQCGVLVCTVCDGIVPHGCTCEARPYPRQGPRPRARKYFDPIGHCSELPPAADHPVILVYRGKPYFLEFEERGSSSGRVTAYRCTVAEDGAVTLEDVTSRVQSDSRLTGLQRCLAGIIGRADSEAAFRLQEEQSRRRTDFAMERAVMGLPEGEPDDLPIRLRTDRVRVKPEVLADRNRERWGSQSPAPRQEDGSPLDAARADEV